MANSRPPLVLYMALAVLITFTPLQAHDDREHHIHGAVEAPPKLHIEETTFEANGAPLHVLNARVRVKNLASVGHRGYTAHFFYRLKNERNWTLIGKRPLPGILPGHAVVCDLMTSTEGTKLVGADGEVQSCQYRVEVRKGNDVTAKEGAFHPGCLFDHDHNEHEDEEHEHPHEGPGDSEKHEASDGDHKHNHHDQLDGHRHQGEPGHSHEHDHDLLDEHQHNHHDQMDRHHHHENHEDGGRHEDGRS